MVFSVSMTENQQGLRRTQYWMYRKCYPQHYARDFFSQNTCNLVVRLISHCLCWSIAPLSLGSDKPIRWCWQPLIAFAILELWAQSVDENGEQNLHSDATGSVFPTVFDIDLLGLALILFQCVTGIIQDYIYLLSFFSISVPYWAEQMLLICLYQYDPSDIHCGFIIIHCLLHWKWWMEAFSCYKKVNCLPVEIR